MISIHFVVQRMQNIGTGSSGVLLMFDDLDQEVKRYFFLPIMLIPVSFAITATLNGCSGLGSSASSNNSTITHFEYTNSPLALTMVPSNRVRDHFRRVFRNDRSPAGGKPFVIESGGAISSIPNSHSALLGCGYMGHAGTGEWTVRLEGNGRHDCQCQEKRRE